ncbi:hypothetical protein, partial [Desulfosporosinus sp. I2]|uniref:hypothetical protein n=1 Tax=Desulfosporosinus sp. I2 TaxID=1617025 RepID=UPI001A9A428E
MSGGHYRRATHLKGRLSGEGEPFATLRPNTHSPAVWIERVEPRSFILINTCYEHKNAISLEI